VPDNHLVRLRTQRKFIYFAGCLKRDRKSPCTNSSSRVRYKPSSQLHGGKLRFPVLNTLLLESQPSGNISRGKHLIVNGAKLHWRWRRGGRGYGLGHRGGAPRGCSTQWPKVTAESRETRPSQGERPKFVGDDEHLGRNPSGSRGDAQGHDRAPQLESLGEEVE
jgi:hypothetical protein